MNIVMVTTWNQACGISTYAESLVPKLRDIGHRVIVATEEWHGATTPAMDEFCGWSRGRGLTDDALAKLAKAKPDIIHWQHEFGLFPNTAQLKKQISALSDSRHVITLHTPSLCPERDVRSLYYNAKLICHTRKGACLYRAEWIPHPITGLSRHKPEGYLLVPGFISRRKKIISTVKAFLAANTDLKLKIVGKVVDSEYYQKLLRVVANADVEGKITITSKFVRNEDLQDLFSKANAVILNGEKQTDYSASGQLSMAKGGCVPVLAKNTEIYRDPHATLFDSERELTALINNLCFLQPPSPTERMTTLSWRAVAYAHEKVYEGKP